MNKQLYNCIIHTKIYTLMLWATHFGLFNHWMQVLDIKLILSGHNFYFVVSCFWHGPCLFKKSNSGESNLIKQNFLN